MNKSDKHELKLLIIAFLFGGLVMYLLLQVTSYFNSNNIISNKNRSKVYEKSSLSTSFDKIFDAVVLIQTIKDEEVKSNGSGFIYKVDDKYGYILTNEHIISTDKVIITFSNDKETEATVLGKDKYLDLAVLRVDKKHIKLIATLGKSNDLKIGDMVYAVGSPMGYTYRNSVSSGILSGKDRLVSTELSSSTNNDWVMKVLQIDAPINPGNSGGPILNVNGEVIGICLMKLIQEDIEGMAFAIPIEDAINNLDELEKGTKIERPKLGIDIANTNDTKSLIRHDIEIPKDTTKGVVILDIDKKSSAANSELKKGDIIIKINNNEIKNTGYLKYELFNHKIGEEITITYLRDNKEHQTNIKLQ